MVVRRCRAVSQSRLLSFYRKWSLALTQHL
jgi:hypothetical protein